MSCRQNLTNQPPLNPHLPTVTPPLPIDHARPHRTHCGPAFYLACLQLAQSLHLAQRPAQSILQLNRAFMAKLPPNHPILNHHPLPYRALHWQLSHHHNHYPPQPRSNPQASPITPFLGNPTRHFQHLASRMSPKQPNPRLRTWRAWACFHLSETILPASHYPRDHHQINHQNLSIPPIQTTLKQLHQHSPHPQEASQIQQLLPPS